MVTAILQYAKKQFSFSRIIARIAPENKASISLATKCGMTYEKTIYEQFSIKQRQLNLSGISIQNKIYDGSTNACILGTPQLDNIVEGDEVQIDGEIKAKFVSENKGSNIEVIFETINLICKDKNNYKLVYPALSANIYGEEDLTYEFSDVYVLRDEEN